MDMGVRVFFWLNELYGCVDEWSGNNIFSL